MRIWTLVFALWLTLLTPALANVVEEDYGSDDLVITVTAGNAKVAHGGIVETISTLSGIDSLTLSTSGSITVKDAITIKPLYTTGTVEVASTTVTGTGTTFTTLQPGQKIGFGSTSPAAITEWYVIDEITDGTHLELTNEATVAAGTSYVVLTGVLTLRAGHGINVDNTLTANGGVNLMSFYEPIGGTGSVSCTGPIFVSALHQDLNIGASGASAVVTSGPSNIATITGTPTAGQTVTITVTDASLEGGSLDLDYVVYDGDTNAKIAKVYEMLINSNQALKTIQVTAKASNNVLKISAPTTSTISRTNSANTTITLGPSTLTVSNFASASALHLVGNTITTTSNMTFGTGENLGWSSVGALNVAHQITANGGVHLSSGNSTIGGAGWVASTGPINLQYVEGDVSLTTVGADLVIVSNSTSLTIDTVPTSLSILSITEADTIQTGDNVVVGSGSGIIILQAATSIVHNDDITADEIILNSASITGTGALNGTVTTYP